MSNVSILTGLALELMEDGVLPPVHTDLFDDGRGNTGAVSFPEQVGPLDHFEEQGLMLRYGEEPLARRCLWVRNTQTRRMELIPMDIYSRSQFERWC